MALSIALTTGLTLLLYLTGFFVIFTPLPVVFSCLRRGFFPAVVSFLVALLVLTALYRLPSSPLVFLPLAAFHPPLEVSQVANFSLLYFFYFGWMGFVISRGAASRNLSLEKSVLVMVMACLMLPGLLVFAYSHWIGLDLREEIRTGLHFVIERMIEIEQSSMPTGDDILFLKKNAEAIVSGTVGILPALWVNVTLSILSLNILFLRRWTTLEKTFPGWLEFSIWRLSEGWIWVPITAGGLYFANVYLFSNPLLGMILLNLLLVTAAIYFFQGVAIVSYFFRRRFSPMVRLLAYVIIILFVQMVGIVIVALGIFDFWFDFRKVKRIGGSHGSHIT